MREKPARRVARQGAKGEFVQGEKRFVGEAKKGNQRGRKKRKKVSRAN